MKKKGLSRLDCGWIDLKEKKKKFDENFISDKFKNFKINLFSNYSLFESKRKKNTK
jgi:hypothetical protein